MIANIIKYEFLQNAYLAGLIIGLIAPVIGSFIIIRRLAYISDTLSHVSLAGISIGLFISKKLDLSFNPTYFATLFSVLGGLAIEYLRNFYKNFKEVSMVIIMSASVALSIIMMNEVTNSSIDLMNYLFGSITIIARSDVYGLLVLLLVMVTFGKKLYYKLLALSFDEEQISSTSKEALGYQLIFIVFVSVFIAFSIKTVGALLLGALIVIPISAAMKFAKSFKQTIIYAIIISEVSVLSGLIFSYQFDLPTGAIIVLMNILALLFALVKEAYHEKN